MYTRDQKKILMGRINDRVYKSFKNFNNIKDVTDDILYYMKNESDVYDYNWNLVNGEFRITIKWYGLDSGRFNDHDLMIFDLKEISRQLKLKKICLKLETK